MSSSQRGTFVISSAEGKRCLPPGVSVAQVRAALHVLAVKAMKRVKERR